MFNQKINLVFPLLFFIVIFSSCKKSEELSENFYTCSPISNDSSQQNQNHQKYEEFMQQLVSKGIPSVSMTIYKETDGLWSGANGKADIFNDINLQSCHQTRVGSTVKMFTAVTVLKLVEEGKLNLDDKIADYVSESVISKLENADKATIRQLRNHSSGIYNYIQSLKFQTASLNDFEKTWQPEELLDYAYGQSAYFEVGEDVYYSNTNYILLGMLITEIENKPFYEVFEEKIFIPLNLKYTAFAAKNPVPKGLVRGYIDMYSNFNLTESTYKSGWDYFTADGGLLSNSHDLVIFFKALMNEEIINQNSLAEMLTVFEPKERDENFFPISYGLGIFKVETHKGTAYLHSGDAVGYYANMIYFPKDKTIISYAVNGNYGSLDQYISTKEAMTTFIDLVK
ncbi:serine hydrolase domain-containing protein [Bernardetia sp. MNP-M8]|uniref:serine hydrolase domain-containing protein n=1 Tax=Bernardetia sp. MNP-M8 TaxID=3127470 RepID=UPI0030D09F7D